MEQFAPIIVIILGIIGYYAYKEYSRPGSVSPVNAVKGMDYGAAGRKCITCGYQGPMKTWISNYFAPIIIIFIAVMFFVIPGIIFLALFYGKYKCPSCGAVGKNQPISHAQNDSPMAQTKKCPYCAEDIKSEAIICRYCQREVA